VPNCIAAWSVIFSSGLGVLYFDNQGAEKKAKDDKILVMKVRESVEKKIAIEKIEDFVGRKASINTIRREDDDLWSIVSIDLDLKESQIKTLRGTTRAVYWVRNIEAREPQIVGVVWTKDKEMKLIFGAVLPP
jgi:hypothetical protein